MRCAPSLSFANLGIPALPLSSGTPIWTTTTNNSVRHALTDTEKKAYIDAELCLMSKPAELGLRGSRTRFDDFQVAHALKTEIAHFVVRIALPSYFDSEC